MCTSATAHTQNVITNLKRQPSDGGLNYSGIDRIDSLKDYTIENTVPCCKICNYAKSNLTLKQFQEWAIKLGSRAIKATIHLYNWA